MRDPGEPVEVRGRVRRLSAALLVGALLTGVLGGCGSDDPSGPVGSAPPTSATSTPPTSPSGTPSGTPSQSAPPDGPVSLVDAVVVAADRSDPLSAALAEAVGSGRSLLLDLVLDVDPASDLAAGRLVVPGRGAPPGRDSGLLLQVSPEAVAELAAPLVQLTGTFAVSSAVDGSYVLEALTAESDPALRPEGPDDAARCASPDAAAVRAAADRLAADPSARQELRTGWGSSPALWWAVQYAAQDPDALDAVITTACAAYRG
ncbi:hypothetical protein [Kineococcus glutinatus]|uniref:hypothetical protein n=1 Tax=Kineococcus glutinatus TaxID=1070872 RepID=UPI0031EE0EE4